MEIGIIADDLTGAADAVAGFAQRGFQASVGFKVKHHQEQFPLSEGDALAYDTATRDMAGDQERAIELAVRRAARRLAGLGSRVVFKKIDSTLRGHLRLELEALRLEFPERLAIVCPAFPAQGRTVQSGVLHIGNVPWTATEFAPAGLFGNLTVRGAFGMESDAGAREITGGDIRRGADALESRLLEWQAQGAHTIFCDAVQDADLEILAQTILRRPERYLPVGSAGLARALSVSLPPRATPLSLLRTLTEQFKSGRVLVVVGSLHTSSRRQAQRLSERLQAPPIVVTHAGDIKLNVERAVNEVCLRYTEGQRVVTLTTPDLPEAENHQDFAWMPGSVAWRVCLRQLQANQAVIALVICGGNTAIELCQTFGGTGLRITGEWLPGIAISHLIATSGGEHNPGFNHLPIVTKAGGFGDDATLFHLVGLT